MRVWREANRKGVSLVCFGDANDGGASFKLHARLPPVGAGGEMLGGRGMLPRVLIPRYASSTTSTSHPRQQIISSRSPYRGHLPEDSQDGQPRGRSFCKIYSTATMSPSLPFTSGISVDYRSRMWSKTLIRRLSCDSLMPIDNRLGTPSSCRKYMLEISLFGSH